MMTMMRTARRPSAQDPSVSLVTERKSNLSVEPAVSEQHNSRMCC